MARSHTHTFVGCGRRAEWRVRNTQQSWCCWRWNAGDGANFTITTLYYTVYRVQSRRCGALVSRPTNGSVGSFFAAPSALLIEYTATLQRKPQRLTRFPVEVSFICSPSTTQFLVHSIVLWEWYKSPYFRISIQMYHSYSSWSKLCELQPLNYNPHDQLINLMV